MWDDDLAGWMAAVKDVLWVVRWVDDLVDSKVVWLEHGKVENLVDAKDGGKVVDLVVSKVGWKVDLLAVD